VFRVSCLIEYGQLVTGNADTCPVRRQVLAPEGISLQYVPHPTYMSNQVIIFGKYFSDAYAKLACVAGKMVNAPG